MLTQQRIAVSADGETVTWQIGNTPIRMVFDVALKLAAWMRLAARDAKRASGDRSMAFSMRGMLDAEPVSDRTPKPFRSKRALQLVDLTHGSKLAVRLRGQLVVVTVGPHAIELPHQAALTISTWLRMRGKEAQRNAGAMTEHWSQIGRVEAIEAGESPFAAPQH